MQQELVTSTNGDRLRSAIGSAPFLSDQRLSSPPYLATGGDFLCPYTSVISATGGTPTRVTSLPVSASVSLTPSSVSFDEEGPAATEKRLYLARLTLQYQEIAERYELCLSHIQDAVQEAEALRQENAKLRIAKGELTKRLSLLSEKQHNRIVTSAAAGHPALSIVDEFRRLGVADPPAETSPTSVLAFQESRFARRAAEKRVLMPKSISVRSSGYLKLNQAGSFAHRNAPLRVSGPVMVGSTSPSEQDNGIIGS